MTLIQAVAERLKGGGSVEQALKMPISFMTLRNPDEERRFYEKYCEEIWALIDEDSELLYTTACEVGDFFGQAVRNLILRVALQKTIMLVEAENDAN